MGNLKTTVLSMGVTAFVCIRYPGVDTDHEVQMVEKGGGRRYPAKILV